VEIATAHRWFGSCGAEDSCRLLLSLSREEPGESGKALSAPPSLPENPMNAWPRLKKRPRGVRYEREATRLRTWREDRNGTESSDRGTPPRYPAHETC
jgi:hypothetical protein